MEPEKTEAIEAANSIVAVQEAEKIVQSEHSIVVRAVEVAANIKDQPTYDEAVDLRKKLKDAIGRITDRMNPTKDKLHKAHREFCDLMTEMQRPFVDAIARMEPQMRDFARAEEKRRQDKIDADRKAIEDQRIKDAQVLQDAGKPEAAMNVISRDIRGVPKPPVFKKGGIRTKIDFEISITDPDTIVKNVAAGLLPKSYVEVNARAILQDVRAKNGKVTIPGVSIREV